MPREREMARTNWSHWEGLWREGGGKGFEGDRLKLATGGLAVQSIEVEVERWRLEGAGRGLTAREVRRRLRQGASTASPGGRRR